MQRSLHPLCFPGFLSQAFFELVVDLGNKYFSKMKAGTDTEAWPSRSSSVLQPLCRSIVMLQFPSPCSDLMFA